MSIEQPKPKVPSAFEILIKRTLNAIRNNWKLKLLSLLIAITIWGALISQDASLTREKTFENVPVSITGTETLLRNGMIVVEGLDRLDPIRMRVDVPQKAYDNVSASNYSVRVDLSRITSVGRQTIPILTLSTATYGSVSWLSANDITVRVEEYITRRRIPVKAIQSGQVPQGFYSSSVSVDPANVIISGPKSMVERIDSVVAQVDMSAIDSNTGVQYTAVPFRLLDKTGKEIKSNLISVTSENVLLDTILIEQTIYPTKLVDVNLTGVTKGRVNRGYQITAITSDPAQIEIAGNPQSIDSISLLDLASFIDVSDMTETVIRALRVDKPDGVVNMSDSAVYITVEITPTKLPDK